jgi:hypothetical protein
MSGERSVQPEKSDRRCQCVMSRRAGCRASRSGPGRRHACRLSVVGGDPDTFFLWPTTLCSAPVDHLECTLDRVVDEQREVPELTKVRAKDLPEVKVHGMKVEHVEIDCDLCDHMALGPTRMVGKRLSNQARRRDCTGRNRALPTFCAGLAKSRGSSELRRLVRALRRACS